MIASIEEVAVYQSGNAKTVFVLEECGDDYHGSKVIAAFESHEDAERYKGQLELHQEPCECGFKYWYAIATVALFFEKDAG